MQTISTLDTLRGTLDRLRQSGPVAFVPTMGALHEGHLTLVREAARAAAHVVVSIFVNPMQFGPNEDLDAYPRQMEQDSRMLSDEGVAVLWNPGVETVYPAGFATTISVKGVSEGFCGASRPGHFDGVATVVAKLFNHVQPDMAFFGEKDWQQLAVIRRMARDLDLARPHVDRIIGVPTVRESDGLAMSSRNRYLDPAQRRAAVALPDAMKGALAAIRSGTPVTAALAALRAHVLGAGFASIDYAELADAQSLDVLSRRPEARPARLLVAARLGTTRLIDNMGLE